MNSFVFHHLLTILTFMLTLFFASSNLRSGKPAATTFAWLLLIVGVPYVGIPLYIMFGARKFPTKLRWKETLFTTQAVGAMPWRLSGIQKILSRSGMPGPKENKSIELIATGEDSFSEYLKLIHSAKKSICISTFILGKDAVGQAIIDALTERASSGIDVRVIVDSLSAILLRQPSMTRFKKSGGRLAYFMPILHLPFRGRFNLRNHRKLLLVDGHIALVGGMNLAREYMGPKADESRWEDVAVKIEGSCADDLQNIFSQDWIFADRDKNMESAEKQTSAPGGRKHLAQIIASGPDVTGDPLYDVLLSKIHSAAREVRIVTPYFIPDESLSKALELAAKRGVKVQILTPKHSNHFLADLARGSFIRQLGRAGVEFHFYPKMIHAKAVLIDKNIGILGSANFDMRSLLINYELGILIYDTVFLKRVNTWINSRINQSGQAYPRENFIRQITEGIGRVIGPFI